MAKAELRGTGDRPEGRLRVMAPHAFGQQRLVGLLAAYLERHRGDVPGLSHGLIGPPEWHCHGDMARAMGIGDNRCLPRLPEVACP
jgi:hypothetical protein